MNRLPTLALVLAALQCACTPMQWEKENVSAEQFNGDEQDCRERAWREATARTWIYQPVAPVFARDTSGRGFFVWPGGAVVDPFATQHLEEMRLAQFCMESKGYKLVPAPRK